MLNNNKYNPTNILLYLSPQKIIMPVVTFRKIANARTGNILFQYLFCKRLSLAFGHKYVPIEDCDQSFGPANSITITDANAAEILSASASGSGSDTVYESIRTKNIVCEGFFQRSEYYVPVRAELLAVMKQDADNDSLFGSTNTKQSIREFLNAPNKIPISNRDVVISLRLDDFIQLPCPTSDIVCPTFYTDILESMRFDRSMQFDRLFIVCDKIRHDWERAYLRFFDKWSPILVQGSLLDDAALMRDAPTLIHSNSTLCWFMSFLDTNTNSKRRYIPKTNFYGGQSLDAICPSTDRLIHVKPLTHKQVYELDYRKYIVETSIVPMSYCIPDEMIVGPSAGPNSGPTFPDKTRLVAELVPGQQSTYTFGASEEGEAEYNAMYRRSKFAYTQKKGGWDCLRHYEIMANGCIPIFKDLARCPESTLTTFPKQLIREATELFLSGRGEDNPEIDCIRIRMLDHVRSHCSASSTAKRFLLRMGKPNARRVLMVRCDEGVNYSRETLWIGLHRHITFDPDQDQNHGSAIEYPRIDYLYDTYFDQNNNNDQNNEPNNNKKIKLYGNGFTYSGRLQDDGRRFSESEIVEKIRDRWFDLVVFGKVGPDELREGSLPSSGGSMPLWDHVFKSYGKHEIAFIYGGDECIDLTTDNRYRDHIMKHAQFATCFVRELKM